MDKKQLKIAQKTPKFDLSGALREAKLAVKDANTIIEAYIDAPKAAVAGGAIGHISNLTQKASGRIDAKEKKQKIERDARNKRIKTIQKRIEKRKKEQALAAATSKKEEIEKLDYAIERTKKQKETPRTKQRLKKLELKKGRLEKSTTHPLKEMEKRLKQIEKIKKTDAQMAALEAKLEKIRKNNPQNKWDVEIMRLDGIVDKTEENVSQSFDDLLDYMNANFEDSVNPSEPEATAEPELQESKKTISDITDFLMEELYETYNKQ